VTGKRNLQPGKDCLRRDKGLHIGLDTGAEKRRNLASNPIGRGKKEILKKANKRKETSEREGGDPKDK